MTVPLADPSGTRSDAVVVRGVSKHYPRRRALLEAVRHPFSGERVPSLVDVSLSVAPGEFLGILGPNGAGKTTLLKILATFITPDVGEVRVEGHDVVADPGRARALVAPVIASERSLYWRLTARENLELFGTLWQVPVRELRDRVEDALRVVQLADTGAKLVGTFSSGMMQRLLIARALLSRPRVLLLDEPTRSLDPVSARDFRAFLREELGRTRQCAVVIATHSTDEAFGLCDRVVVLHRGRLVAMGEPGHLRRTLVDRSWVLLTRSPDHPLLAPWSGGVAAAAPRSASPGATRIEMRLEGGDDEAARVLRDLVAGGVDVVGFSPEQGSLATLIEQAIERGAS